MSRTYVIAELSANHNNDLELALKTIDAIAACGADAVKVQTYNADSMTLDVNNHYFGPRKSGLWKGRTLYSLFEEGSLPNSWLPTLKSRANSLGLDFFSTPFDLIAVDVLEELGVPKYKIASPEINYTSLIEKVAKTGKPIIISTGLAEFSDIDLAVEICKNAGNHDITLLKCTSQYPSKKSDANLLNMLSLKEDFGVKVGLSDHTMGSEVPIAAVAMGASVVEKHFVLDRELGGIDSEFSMNPEEFKTMVDGIRLTERILGKSSYRSIGDDCLRRRSIFVSKDIEKGELFSEANLKVVRPGHGLHPRYYRNCMDLKATRSYKRGEPLDINPNVF